MKDQWVFIVNAAFILLGTWAAVGLAAGYIYRRARGPRLMRIGEKPNRIRQALALLAPVAYLAWPWVFEHELRGREPGSVLLATILIPPLIQLFPLAFRPERFWSIHEKGILFAGEGSRPGFVPWAGLGAPELRDAEVIIHGPAMFNDGHSSHAIPVQPEQRTALEAILATHLEPLR